MLTLRRTEGQWVEIMHKESGDIIRIRVCDIRSRYPGKVDLWMQADHGKFLAKRPDVEMQNGTAIEILGY